MTTTISPNTFIPPVAKTPPPTNTRPTEILGSTLVYTNPPAGIKPPSAPEALSPSKVPAQTQTAQHSASVPPQTVAARVVQTSPSQPVSSSHVLSSSANGNSGVVQNVTAAPGGFLKSGQQVSIPEEIVAEPANVLPDVPREGFQEMTLAQSFNDLGSREFKQGNFKDAIKHFKEALQVEPGSAEAHSNLGLALMEAGNLQEAQTHFLEVLKINPEDQIAKANLNLVTVRLKESKKTSPAV